jgi:hypothetical protein
MLLLQIFALFYVLLSRGEMTGLPLVLVMLCFLCGSRWSAILICMWTCLSAITFMRVDPPLIDVFHELYSGMIYVFVKKKKPVHR